MMQQEKAMTMRAASPSAKPISSDSYGFLQRWIHRESGIFLDESKGYLLQSRLSPIVDREALGTFDELCSHLRKGSPGLARQVIEAMTTHETLFFRDRGPFDALRDSILPGLLAARPAGYRLNLWSAAASSGQEAYSLAIMLLEMGLTSHEVSILGTDLSEKVLERARRGVYGNFEVSRGLPPHYLERYFQRCGSDWQVRDHVRQMVRFQQLDLRQSLRGQGPFDVVLCRNVLIYFDAPTKNSILAELSGVLANGGYLMLGTAETAGSQSRVLQRIQFRDAIAYCAG